MLLLPNGKDIFRDAKYVSMDLEMTGLNRTNDEIIEHGNVFCNSRGLPIAYFGQLIKPVMKCRDPNRPTGVIEVHNITPHMVEEAPTFAEIAREYAAYLDGKIFVGLCSSTDFDFLKRQFLDCGIRFKPGRGIDMNQIMTDAVFADLYGEKMMEIYNNVVKKHRALFDADMAADMLPSVLEFFERFPDRKPTIEPCMVAPYKDFAVAF